MDPEFWLKRWQEGATGFHMTRVTPLLAKYWPSLGVASGARVLVPLCGKSLDMVWLAAQGYRVLGVELSPVAVEQFFEEQKLVAEIHESPLGTHYVAGEIEIICGDVFKVDAGTLGQCEGVYDRGALVALPPSMRRDYAQHVYGQLADGYLGLLLTLEYDQALMEGPPFSVPAAEIQELFSPLGEVSTLARMDILDRSEEHTSELQSRENLVCRLLLEKKK